MSSSLIYNRYHYIGCLWLFLLSFAPSLPLLISPESLRGGCCMSWPFSFFECVLPHHTLFSQYPHLSSPGSRWGPGTSTEAPAGQHLPEDYMSTQIYWHGLHISPLNIWYVPESVLELGTLQQISEQGLCSPEAFILEKQATDKCYEWAWRVRGEGVAKCCVQACSKPKQILCQPQVSWRLQTWLRVASRLWTMASVDFPLLITIFPSG